MDVVVQSGQLTPIDLIVEERFHRAAPGGMGGTKAAGNYSPVHTLLTVSVLNPQFAPLNQDCHITYNH